MKQPLKNLKIYATQIVFASLILVFVALIAFGQDDKKARADILLNEAMQLSQQQTNAEARTKAIAKLTEAQKLFSEIGIKPAEAMCLSMLGFLHQLSGDGQKATDFYRQSLTINRAIGNVAGEANALAMLAIIYNASGDKVRALETNEQAVALFHNLSDKRSEVVTTTNICMLLNDLDKKQESLDCFKKTLPVYQELGDRWGEGLTLNFIGAIYNESGDVAQAFENLTRSLAIRQDINDKQGVMIAINNLGSVYDNVGDKTRALDYYNQAFSLARSSGDKDGEATAVSNIGKVFRNFGEPTRALDYYNQALTIIRTIGSKSREAKILSNIGETYLTIGDLDKAFDFESQALAIFRAIGDRQGEAATLGNMSGIYDQLGEKQLALDSFMAALPVFEANGNKRALSAIFDGLGVIYLGRGENEKAFDYFSKALSLKQKTGDRKGEAITLGNLGGFYEKTNDLTKAADYFNKSLALNVAVKDKFSESVTLNNLGHIYGRAGDKQRAIEHFYRALLLSKIVGDKRGESITLSNLMFAWYDWGNRRQAIFFGKQSVNIIQSLRTSTQSFDKETQKVFLKSVDSTFRNLTEIFLREGRLPEALQTLDAFKDQQFFDSAKIVQTQSRSLTLTPRETEFAARYETTSLSIGKIEHLYDELKRRTVFRQPNAEESKQLQKNESDLKIVSEEFMAVLKQAETEFSKPADEKDKVGEIFSLRELQAVLRELSQSTEQKTVAVYQLVGQENFHLLLITPNDIKTVSTSAKNADLQKRALDFWALLQSPLYDPTIAGKELYDTVFRPLENELPADTKTILWSLDGNLRYVPMAALYDGKTYLVERFNHVNFTRNDRAKMIQATKSVWTATGFGSSDAQTVELFGTKIFFKPLPGVGEEMRLLFKQKDNVRGIFEGEVFEDGKFTKKNFLDAMKQRRPLVHISSHFAFRAGDETRSFLLLGDGAVMTLAEMNQQNDLFKGVDLLTLSACNTAAQREGNGREIDAFSELAQRLGASSVIATLWAVADNSTPFLTRRFYDLKINRNLNKAEALRQAQLTLLRGESEAKPAADRTDSPPVKIVIVKSPEDKKRQKENTRGDEIYLDEQVARKFVRDTTKPFAHPYYWSPFILFGNWR